MKTFVVGILSMFENELKLFKVTANSPYEAVKKAFIDFTPEEHKQSEIDWQSSEQYPKDIEGLHDAYADIPFNFIEI